MTKLYIVRHGQSVGNVAHEFQGSIDADLSPLGLQQIDSLAERFRGVELDAVYASPLKRAFQTACAINRFHSNDIVTDSRLAEIHVGKMEGTRIEDLPALFPDCNRQWADNPAGFVSPGGESMAEVYARVSEAVREIADKHKGQTVAIASHGCAIRNMLCFLHGYGLARIGEIDWVGNTGVSLAEFDANGTPHVVYINDQTHLPPEIANLHESLNKAFERAAGR